MLVEDGVTRTIICIIVRFIICATPALAFQILVLIDNPVKDTYKVCLDVRTAAVDCNKPVIVEHLLHLHILYLVLTPGINSPMSLSFNIYFET